MGVGAGLYMYVVVVQKFTFAVLISWWVLVSLRFHELDYTGYPSASANYAFLSCCRPRVWRWAESKTWGQEFMVREIIIVTAAYMQRLSSKTGTSTLWFCCKEFLHTSDRLGTKYTKFSLEFLYRMDLWARLYRRIIARIAFINLSPDICWRMRLLPRFLTFVAVNASQRRPIASSTRDEPKLVHLSVKTKISTIIRARFHFVLFPQAMQEVRQKLSVTRQLHRLSTWFDIRSSFFHLMQLVGFYPSRWRASV